MSDGVFSSDQVYQKLFSYILQQKLGPGDRLNVDVLGRLIGVSQTPIRQALERLQSDGLVIRKFNSGFRVSNLPTKEHLLETLDFRLMFEAELVKRAARRIDQKGKGRIKENIQALEAAVLNPGFDQFKLFEVDGAFHTIVADIAGNALASVTLSNLIRTSSVFRLKYQPVAPNEIFEEHRSIANAILKEDPAAAQIAMEDHLRISIRRVGAALVPTDER